MKLPKNIKEQRKLIKDKEVSHVELLDTYFERIDKFDKSINSFLTLLKESAYDEAKKCDKLFSEWGSDVYKKYPLLGTVISLKDLFSLDGVRTTASSKVLDNYTAVYDATSVARLKQAGCIFVGKTNCDAWAHGSSGENSDYGPSKNPWDYKYVPGGSSSGSAASVSSDFCLASTGTDTGGSIRLPANFCGVYGLKPTWGAVSRYGVVAMASSLDCVGFFSKCSDDTKLLFNTVKGVDGFDATVSKIKLIKLKRHYKLGVPKEYFSKGLDDQVKKEVDRVIKLLGNNGFEFVSVSLPSTDSAIAVYYIIQPAEVSSNLARYDGVRYGHYRSYFAPEAKRRIILGTHVLSAGYYDKYYIKAMQVREKISDEFDNVFSKVDALIAPVSPTPPFRLGEKTHDPLQMYLADVYTVAANIAGIPGFAIPSNVGKNGLPLGFQLFGKKFHEEMLFDIGKKFEVLNNKEFTPQLV